MKIQYFSDLHVEFSNIDIPETDADIIIAAGDIGVGLMGLKFLQKLNKPVFYVPGNHEFYDQDYNKLWEALEKESAGSNVIVLGNSIRQIFHKVNGRGNELHIIGSTLWTDFELCEKESYMDYANYARNMMSDYHYIRNGDHLITPEETRSFCNYTQGYIAAALGEYSQVKKLVVTHHLPSALSIDERYWRDVRTVRLNAAFASNLDYLFRPELVWIHGHTHSSCNYSKNGTKVLANPRGYSGYENQSPENPNFNAGQLLEINT